MSDLWVSAVCAFVELIAIALTYYLLGKHLAVTSVRWRRVIASLTGTIGIMLLLFVVGIGFSAANDHDTGMSLMMLATAYCSRAIGWLTIPLVLWCAIVRKPKVNQPLETSHGC